MNSEPWSTRMALRIADALADPLQRLHDILAAIAEARIDGRREAGLKVSTIVSTRILRPVAS